MLGGYAGVDDFAILCQSRTRIYADYEPVGSAPFVGGNANQGGAVAGVVAGVFGGLWVKLLALHPFVCCVYGESARCAGGFAEHEIQDGDGGDNEQDCFHV